MILSEKCYTIFVISFMLLNIHANGQVFLPNVDCGPHVDYVETDPGFYRYNPYVVRLHRCHGSNVGANPQNKKCISEQSGVKDLNIFVFDKGVPKIIQVQNHTVCSHVCMLNQTSCTPYETFTSNEECSCKCNYTKTPNPNPCKLPFYWDQNRCDCTCQHTSLDCGTNKVFDKNLCKCVCKQEFNYICARNKQILDEQTCQCYDPPVVTGAAQSDKASGVSGALLAVIMILEALFIVTFYLLFYVYCYKRVYLVKKEEKYKVNSHSRNYNQYLSHESIEPTTEENQQKMPITDNNSNDSNGGYLYSSTGDFHEDKDWSHYGDESNHNLFNGDNASSSEKYGDTLSPPSYVDCMSEHSDENYASVTQV